MFTSAPNGPSFCSLCPDLSDSRPASQWVLSGSEQASNRRWTWCITQGSLLSTDTKKENQKHSLPLRTKPEQSSSQTKSPLLADSFAHSLKQIFSQSFQNSWLPTSKQQQNVKGEPNKIKKWPYHLEWKLKKTAVFHSCFPCHLLKINIWKSRKHTTPICCQFGPNISVSDVIGD